LAAVSVSVDASNNHRILLRCRLSLLSPRLIAWTLQSLCQSSWIPNALNLNRRRLLRLHRHKAALAVAAVGALDLPIARLTGDFVELFLDLLGSAAFRLD